MLFCLPCHSTMCRDRVWLNKKEHQWERKCQGWSVRTLEKSAISWETKIKDYIMTSSDIVHVKNVTDLIGLIWSESYLDSLLKEMAYKQPLTAEYHFLVWRSMTDTN